MGWLLLRDARAIGGTHNTALWKTRDLALRPGEPARFVVINKAGFGRFPFMIFLGASLLYLAFERDK